MADPALDAYDVPPSGQESRVEEWINEASELRWRSAGDEEGSLDTILDVNSPMAVLGALRRVRSRSDRVEQLLVNARRAKRRAKSTFDRVTQQASEREAEAVTDHAARRLEYESALEKRSMANLATMEERRLVFQAQRLVDITIEAYDIINTIHWGLDGVRKDLRSALNALQFESTLER